MKKGFVYDLISVNSKLCFIELWSNKTRSVITSFGIFLGVASLLVNISFMRAMDDNLKKSMEAIGGLSMISIKNKEQVSDKEKLDFRRSQGLKISEVEQLGRMYPYVKAVLPQVEMHATISAQGKHAWSHTLAVSLDHLRAYNFELSKGRGFTSEDFLMKSAVCIVGTGVLDRLFGGGPPVDPVGQQITINRVQFTIIGVIYSEDKYSWRTRQVFIPFSIYQLRFGGSKGELEEIAVELKNSSFVPRAMRDFPLQMKMFHRGVEDFEIVANETRIEEMKQAALGMKVLLGAIAVITLLVGGISIMNIMFATIGDRIREIGIRKALGAKEKDIFVQFLIEAVMLCCVGGIPGMILGTAVTWMPKGVFPFVPALTPGDYLLSVGCTIIAGISSGMFPALGAARMQPVDALRY
jgi:putative ABC transport system permease protein